MSLPEASSNAESPEQALCAKCSYEALTAKTMGYSTSRSGAAGRQLQCVLLAPASRV